MAAVESLVTAIAELQTKLGDAELQIDEAQQRKLLAYLDQLAKWNSAYNLTSIPRDQWIDELLLDALVALPYLNDSEVSQRSLLDVGSGAGLPGVPLALARPELNVTCLDSNGKKTRFINQVKIDLQIPNLDVVQSRVEAFSSEQGYDLIVSRAYAELNTFLTSTEHLLAEGGNWLAWKGEKLEQELNQLTIPVRILDKIQVSLPGVTAQRYLVKLGRCT